MFGGHSARRKSRAVSRDILQILRGSLTGWTRDVQSCQERVHGWGAREEDRKDLRCQAGGLWAVCTFMLIERLD
jgi:hypothetical protein